MSRSYRKPWFKDSYGSKAKKFFKRQASRKIRNSDDVPDGKAYRRFYDPWNITDWKYQWDPEPTVYFIGGKQRIVEPTPEWKVRRK